MNYVVNVDYKTHEIFIHHTACSQYLERAEANDPTDSGWFGPYEILDEARGRVEYESRQMGSANILSSPCHRCPPLA